MLDFVGSNSTIAVCPLPAAHEKAVRPFSVSKTIFAPLLSNTVTTVACLWFAAWVKGELPPLSLWFGSTDASSKVNVLGQQPMIMESGPMCLWRLDHALSESKLQ